MAHCLQPLPLKPSSGTEFLPPVRLPHSLNLRQARKSGVISVFPGNKANLHLLQLLLPSQLLYDRPSSPLLILSSLLELISPSPLTSELYGYSTPSPRLRHLLQLIFLAVEANVSNISPASKPCMAFQILQPFGPMK